MALPVELADDLVKLHRILCMPVRDEGDIICRDAQSLLSAAEECREATTLERWQYDVKLVFDIQPGRNALPEKLKGATLEMLLDIEGHCEEEHDHPSDPLCKLAFEIVLSGTAPGGTKHHAAWHLDRHPGGHLMTEENDSDEFEGEPGDVHPRYHFHFGGRRMFEKSKYFGPAMLLGAPRLVHPPLDAVLGVDFVLSNFKSADWRELQNSNPDYLLLQRRAQSRFWIPYIRSINSCWVDAMVQSSQWNYNDPWPLLAKHPTPPEFLSPEKKKAGNAGMPPTLKGRRGSK